MPTLDSGSMILLTYLFDMYLLIFEGHASWSQLLGICLIIGLRYYWICRLGKICNIFFYRLHRCENAMLVLNCTQSLASVTCFSQQGQDVRIKISSAWMHSCDAVLFPVQYRLFTHAVLFADTCFVCQIAWRILRYLFWTLPLFLMVHASTLSAIPYSAAAAGNLVSASSSSSAPESSDLNSPASDALLVAHLPFLQLSWFHLLVLTIRLVLWCVLSLRGGRLCPSNRKKFRQYKFSHSSCQALFCLCSMWLVEGIAEHISFCAFSYSSIRCARPLLRHMRFMVTSVLRRSFNSRKRAQSIHRSERFQISSLKIVHSLLWWSISITHCRAFQWAEAFSDSFARYVSILCQSNRSYSKFCACSGCTLYLIHMISRTAPLVYLKFCARIGGFSWATHDWSRG